MRARGVTLSVCVQHRLIDDMVAQASPVLCSMCMSAKLLASSAIWGIARLQEWPRCGDCTALASCLAPGCKPPSLNGACRRSNQRAASSGRAKTTMETCSRTLWRRGAPCFLWCFTGSCVWCKQQRVCCCIAPQASLLVHQQPYKNRPCTSAFALLLCWQSVACTAWWERWPCTASTTAVCRLSAACMGRYGSLGLMTSVLVCPDGKTVEAEAAHGAFPSLLPCPQSGALLCKLQQLLSL